MSVSLQVLTAVLFGFSGGVFAAQQQPAAAHSAQQPAAPLTLEQAVARVQKQTGGKVLKADSRNLGGIVEYRIKILTPNGQVRVITFRNDQRDTHMD